MRRRRFKQQTIISQTIEGMMMRSKFQLIPLSLTAILTFNLLTGCAPPDSTPPHSSNGTTTASTDASTDETTSETAESTTKEGSMGIF